MTNAQNNDLILQYELRRLNGALQEAFALERQEFQQWATQAEQTIIQLGQDKAALYNEIDSERARANAAVRAADYWKAVAEGAGADVEEAAAALAADEQRIADGIDAAIAPATVNAPATADGKQCVNCGAGGYSAEMPMDNDGNCLNCGESFTEEVKPATAPHTVTCEHEWISSEGRTASGVLCRKCGDYNGPNVAQ